MSRPKLVLLFAFALLAVAVALPDSYTLPDYNAVDVVDPDSDQRPSILQSLRTFAGSIWDRFICSSPTPSPSPSPSVPVVTCNCGITSRQTLRVIGGSDATRATELPWQVLISRNGIPDPVCSGALIHESWVLTAASCLSGDTSVVVTAGINSRLDSSANSTYQSVPGTVTTHQNYSASGTSLYKDNDLALIKLSSPFAKSVAVNPICLPITERNNSFIGQTVTISGWGINSAFSLNMSSISLPVLNSTNTSCPTVSFSNKTLCVSSSTGAGPCGAGDGGAPVAWLEPVNKRGKLVGIVSQGVVACGVTRPVIRATRVANYLDWITLTTGQTFCTPP